MRIVFHPEAYDEMLESARFFEEKSAGLGIDLIAAVQESTRRISRFPKSGAIEEQRIRRCLVHGFPFTILYEFTPDQIYIAAVMHQHRKPGYWRERLK